MNWCWWKDFMEFFIIFHMNLSFEKKWAEMSILRECCWIEICKKSDNLKFEVIERKILLLTGNWGGEKTKTSVHWANSVRIRWKNFAIWTDGSQVPEKTEELFPNDRFHCTALHWTQVDSAILDWILIKCIGVSPLFQNQFQPVVDLKYFVSFTISKTNHSICIDCRTRSCHAKQISFTNSNFN